MSSEELINKLAVNIDQVIIGKRFETTNILKGIVAGGHVLIEDVPGVGKTTMVKAIAKCFNLSFSRIQFTPDLLPSDITGVSVFNQKSFEFEFKKGPIFSNIVLADEINRTSPKTQSALLQAMEEKEISEGNTNYPIEEPFMVLATLNPVEYEGTYILPEALLDRFIMKVSIGYLNNKDEKKFLISYKDKNPIKFISPVASKEDLFQLRKEAAEVFVKDEIYDYIIKICNATRENKMIRLGVSTRGTMALMRISQVNALFNGRRYVIPEDVKEAAPYALSHRLILSREAKGEKMESRTVINDILRTIIVPKVVK
ncbi:MAG: MoxR family ATPase [Clostridiaceae bacterium]